MRAWTFNACKTLNWHVHALLHAVLVCAHVEEALQLTLTEHSMFTVYKL